MSYFVVVIEETLLINPDEVGVVKERAMLLKRMINYFSEPNCNAVIFTLAQTRNVNMYIDRVIFACSTMTNAASDLINHLNATAEEHVPPTQVFVYCEPDYNPNGPEALKCINSTILASPAWMKELLFGKEPTYKAIPKT